MPKYRCLSLRDCFTSGSRSSLGILGGAGHSSQRGIDDRAGTQVKALSLPVRASGLEDLAAQLALQQVRNWQIVVSSGTGVAQIDASNAPWRLVQWLFEGRIAQVEQCCRK